MRIAAYISFTQIKVAMLFSYPQYKFSHFISKISFAVIAHNTEQQCGFGFALPPKNRILPRVVIYPSLGTTG